MPTEGSCWPAGDTAAGPGEARGNPNLSGGRGYCFLGVSNFTVNPGGMLNNTDGTPRTETLVACVGGICSTFGADLERMHTGMGGMVKTSAGGRNRPPRTLASKAQAKTGGPTAPSRWPPGPRGTPSAWAPTRTAGLSTGAATPNQRADANLRPTGKPRRGLRKATPANGNEFTRRAATHPCRRSPANAEARAGLHDRIVNNPQGPSGPGPGRRVHDGRFLRGGLQKGAIPF